MIPTKLGRPFSGRPIKIPTSFGLFKSTIELIDRESKLLGISKSELIERMIAKYFSLKWD